MKTLKDKLSSPIEILLKTLSYPLVVGLSPQTITITIYLIKFLNTYWHTNIDLRMWLGNILQIPNGRKYICIDLLVIDVLKLKGVIKGSRI